MITKITQRTQPIASTATKAERAAAPFPDNGGQVDRKETDAQGRHQFISRGMQPTAMVPPEKLSAPSSHVTLTKTARQVGAQIIFKAQRAKRQYMEGKLVDALPEKPSLAYRTIKPFDDFSVRMRHLQLAAHTSDASGTGVVAAWVADLSRQISAEVPTGGLTVPKHRKASYTTKFEAVASLLDKLQALRSSVDALRGYLKFMQTKADSDSLLSVQEAYLSHVALFILSELKKGKGVLMPVDVFAASQGPSNNILLGHATLIYVEPPTDGRGRCKMHHFETNGVWTYKLDPVAVDNRRRQRSSFIDRTVKLDPNKMSLTESMPSRSAKGRAAKTFSRSSLWHKFRSLSGDGASAHKTHQDHVLDDVDDFAQLLAPDLGCKPPCETVGEGVDAARSVFSSLGAVSIEAQRVTASQRSGSCELKSVVAFLQFYLDDEVAFQEFRVKLVTAAFQEANALPEGQSLVEVLTRRVNAATGRLRIALVVDKPGR
ncbi:MAG: hypothetical protein EOO38_01600 [Cytophagaceae bacterium]|nr:MAG: hypothetical protein EOO38_01600 [Cytophagaceae bacterium]